MGARKKEKAAKDPAQAERRESQRQQRVQDGLAALRVWMQDLIRKGLTAVQGQSHAFWESQAARLVDAQAPGMAAMVRGMAGIPHSGKDWPDRLLEHLGLLHLLLKCHERLETLDADTQKTVRAVSGRVQNKDEVFEQPAVHDRWAVLGTRVEDEHGLVTERVWLRGMETGRDALLLDFYHRSKTTRERVAPPAETCIDADIVYYPGASPLRALIKAQHGGPLPFQLPRGHELVGEALKTYRIAITNNPWLPQFPFLLHSVVPVLEQRKTFAFHLVDDQRHSLRLSASFDRAWELMSISGGRPIAVFGEWTGEAFLPLNMFESCMEGAAST